MNDRCPDCQVAPGVVHDEGCDVARCLATGLQRLMCAGEFRQISGDKIAHMLGAHAGSCGHDVWTGEWPGSDDCRRLGFWTGDGHPDLNRLVRECWWDRETRRWVLR